MLMRNVGCVLVLIAVATSPASAGLRAPVQGTGDLEFIADMPVFFDELGRARVDLAVRVDHEQVRMSHVSRWKRDVAVTWKLAREGVVAVDTTQVFRIEGNPDPSLRAAGRRVETFELLEISARVSPGRWAATVEVVTIDEQASRARAQGVLAVPAWSAAQARLSDPEFRLRTATASLPHPERMYGVGQDTLEAYVEISGATAGERAQIDVEIHDREFGTMDATSITLMPRAGVDAAMIRMPLAMLPDGNYALRLRPAWAPDQAVEAEFVVNWRVERAVQERDDVLVEAELVLDPDTFAQFGRLSRPRQVQTIQRFWDERDPTPGTARNELYDRFLARVAYAARFYGTAQVPGPLTDRGKIYIRYGRPAEVEVNVLPGSDDDLEAAIGQVHDAFAIDVQGYNARATINDGGALKFSHLDTGSSDAETARDLRRNNLRIGREAGFELWSYDAQGDRLFDDTTMWSEDIDLRFLFVDRNGTGEYRLDFSNVEHHH